MATRSPRRIIRSMSPRRLLAVALFLTAGGHLLAAPALVGGGGSETSVAFLIGAFLGFLVLAALFAGSETALVSVDRVSIDQLAEQGDRRAGLVRKLIESPERMLGLTLVGTNLMHVMVAQVGLILWVVILARDENIGRFVHETLRTDAAGIATAFTTILVLIFAEILPKTIFRMRASSLALRYSFVLRVFDVLLWPVVAVITAVTDSLVRRTGARVGPTASERDELRLLAQLGEQSGGLLSEQRRMIHGALDLHTRTAAQVMVPLVHVDALPTRTSVARYLEYVGEVGHSRIPVYDERIDNIVGVVHVLDVLYDLENISGTADADDTTIDAYIRDDVRFVPESKQIRSLLGDLRRQGHSIVFVVDEYGGVVGIVTIEDLLEEIVGEFDDERDESVEVRRVGPSTLECDGRTEVDVLRDSYAIRIPTGEYETIAGFILQRVGDVPAAGHELKIGRYTVTVAAADAKTIHTVQIRTAG